MSPITDKHPDLDLPNGFTGYLVNLEIVEFKNGSGWPRYSYSLRTCADRDAADDFVADVLDTLDEAGVTPRSDHNPTAKMRAALEFLMAHEPPNPNHAYNVAMASVFDKARDALKGAAR